MKLYVFNSNTYGPVWFVCAESREAAIEAAQKEVNKNNKDDRNYYQDHLNNCVADCAPYDGGEKCSIDEIGPNTVIMSEVS